MRYSTTELGIGDNVSNQEIWYTRICILFSSPFFSLHLCECNNVVFNVVLCVIIKDHVLTLMIKFSIEMYM